MAIIYRPHKGSIIDAMNEIKFFETKENMLQYICDKANEYSGINIEPCDLLGKMYNEEPDERIGWECSYIVTFKAYDDVKNKESYLRYMGGQKFNHPCGVFGFYTDKYKAKWEENYKDFLSRN